jgi:hypothetical protein
VSLSREPVFLPGAARRPAAALLVGAALAVASSAAASREARADEFQDHVDLADSRAQNERYKEALAELRAAYAIRQSPHLLYLMAQAQQHLGDNKAALLRYVDFLAADPGADPPSAGTRRSRSPSCGGSTRSSPRIHRRRTTSPATSPVSVATSASDTPGMGC